MTTSTSTTLAARLWPAGENPIARNLVLVIGGSLLLWASAKISVPFWPVPMTMQTFAVVALGLALGSRLAVAAVVLYLIEGALGLPVFTGTPAKGIGLAYMMGPNRRLSCRLCPGCLRCRARRGPRMVAQPVCRGAGCPSGRRADLRAGACMARTISRVWRKAACCRPAALPTRRYSQGRPGRSPGVRHMEPCST